MCFLCLHSAVSPLKRARQWTLTAAGLLVCSVLLGTGLSPRLAELAPFHVPPLTSWTNSLGMPFVGGLKPGLKICRWETRVRDYKRFLHEHEKSLKTPSFQQTDNHPVVGISWVEAKAFCDWLTTLEKREGTIASTAFYRLPTDREWTLMLGRFVEEDALPRDLDENADGAFVWGLSWPAPQGSGNFGKDEGVDHFAFTAPVGSFPANELGLFDVAGNVWEWCEDWYDENQLYRVLRGCSWRTETFRNTLATERHAHLPQAQVDCYGFRCVLVDREVFVE